MSDKKRAWPSRPLQVLVFALLLAAAALQVWAPARNPQARAERLYADAWFQWAGSPDRRDAAVARIEAALRLSPGNPRYEQALVWLSDPKQLPVLLKRRALGPDARALAAGIVYVQSARDHGAEQGAGDAGELPALDALIAADPGNALPHYLKAQALARDGRADEALVEVHAGNSLPRLRHVAPALSDAVLNTPVFSLLAADLFATQARFRHLARSLSDLASLRLRQKRVDEAREILEACCNMGVQVAGAEPRMIISFLVGKAVFAIGWSGLEPLLKDFGPRESVDRYRAMSRAFEQGQRDASAFIERTPSVKRMVALSLVPGILQLDGMVSLLLLALALLGWLVTALAARHAEPVGIPSWDWGEGWLARICLATHGIAGLALAGAVAAILSPASKAGEVPAAGLVYLLAAAPLVLPLVVVGLLRRRYHEHTGARTGYAGFLWKSPAPVRAWIHRRLTAALAYQVLFVAALLALAISLYKPLLGAHPWQIERVAVGSLSEEADLVSRCLTSVGGTAHTPEASTAGPR